MLLGFAHLSMSESLPPPLSAVTGIDLWGAVVSTGVVCTFYCTMVCKMMCTTLKCHKHLIFYDITEFFLIILRAV